MKFDPSQPIVALLANANDQDDTWQSAATLACRESVGLIDSVLRDSNAPVDRDIQVCLDAVRNSLTWVLDQPASAREVRITMLRALDIFQKVELAAH